MSIIPKPRTCKATAWSFSFSSGASRLAFMTILCLSGHRQAYRPSKEHCAGDGARMLSVPDGNHSSALIALEQFQGLAGNYTGRAHRPMKNLDARAGSKGKGEPEPGNGGFSLLQMFQIIMQTRDHRPTFLMSFTKPGEASNSAQIMPQFTLTFMPNQDFSHRWGHRSKSGALEFDIHRFDRQMLGEFIRNGLDFKIHPSKVDACHHFLAKALGERPQLDIRDPSPQDRAPPDEDMGRRGSKGSSNAGFGRQGSAGFGRQGNGIPQSGDTNFVILRLRPEQLAKIESVNPPCMWPSQDQLDLIKERSIAVHVTPTYSFDYLNTTIKKWEKFSLEIIPSEMGGDMLKFKICEKIKELYNFDIKPHQFAVGRRETRFGDENEIVQVDDSIFMSDPRKALVDQNVLIYQLVNPLPFGIAFIPDRFDLGKDFDAELRLSMTTQQLKEMIKSSSDAKCTIPLADMAIGYADSVNLAKDRPIWMYGLNGKSRIKVRGGTYGGEIIPLLDIVLLMKLGSGSFGTVYLGYSKKTEKKLAVKILFRYEYAAAAEEVRLAKLFYKASQGSGFASIWSGLQVQNFPHKGGSAYVISMDILGKSLEDLIKHMGKLSKDMVCHLAAQMIDRLKTVHDANYVYRDVKADNFMMGKRESEKNTVFLVDFGLVDRLGTANGDNGLVGTARYCSMAAHLGEPLYRYSDLEALGYLLAYLLKGQLPWKGLGGEYDAIYNGKKTTSPAKLFEGEADVFKNFMQAVRDVKGAQTPDYAGWIAKFNAAKTGNPQFPASFVQVAQSADKSESLVVHTR